ncbi:putative WD repeat-containing protein 3 [Apostichopus japonicus]|uniref:Putative WD repeat-containing protein 3 n=1 Tax=Stichopus japonicus TaxID=307972 RepID=A0A2G8LMY5_STIJA|nr:putative WD repeat-containing protein 3 [Apostichopus japonicus]
MVYVSYIIMGLTKQYLRYAPSALFGVVGTSKANIVTVEIDDIQSNLVAVTAVEDVLIWDLKKGEIVLTLKGEKYEASILAVGRNKSQLAVGYMDGSVKVYDLSADGEAAVTFKGHKSAVTALKFDPSGMRLVSGAKDTDVIVWDVVSECGLYRLKGHKGMITDITFMKEHNILITSSKDTFVKFWDLDTQHCFKTLIGHRTEVWGLSLVSDQRLITGAVESELSVWDITFNSEEIGDDKEPPQKKAKKTFLAFDEDGDDKQGEIDEEGEDESETAILSCTKVGVLRRSGKDRVLTLKTDERRSLLGVHGKDNFVEIFLVCSDEEKKKFLQKKRKRARKRMSKEMETQGKAGETDESVELDVQEEIRNLGTIKAGGKIRSFDLISDAGGNRTLVILLHNNKVEIHQWVGNDVTVTTGSQLSIPAHRSDVRAICFNADNTAILSGSAESVKMWNRGSQQCVRTMASDYILSLAFVPGERHCIAGTKEGHLQLFDIAAGKLLDDVEAHTGALWSISLSPDKRGFITGSADKDIKFWDFEFVDETEDSTSRKRLTFRHVRTLKMAAIILCAKYSPDQKFCGCVAPGQHGQSVLCRYLEGQPYSAFAATLRSRK